MERNRSTRKNFFYTVLIMAAVTFTFGQIAFAAPPNPLTDIKSQAGTVGPKLCSDPSVKLVMNKVLMGNTAKITLTGTVRDPEGKPVDGATVTIEDRAGDPPRHGRPDPAG